MQEKERSKSRKEAVEYANSAGSKARQEKKQNVVVVQTKVPIKKQQRQNSRHHQHQIGQLHKLQELMQQGKELHKLVHAFL